MLPITQTLFRFFLLSIFILFLSIDSKGQQVNQNPSSHEQYVRPIEQKDTVSKKELRKIKRLKKKEERLVKKGKAMQSKPEQVLSQSTNSINLKTDHLIDSAVSSDTTKQSKKSSDKTKKLKSNLVNEAKEEKNENLQKAQTEAVTTLKNTEEGKELEQKAKDLDIGFPDSVRLISNNSVPMLNEINELRKLPSDSAEVVVKEKAKEEASERAVSEVAKMEGGGEATEAFNQIKSYKKDSVSVDKVAEDLIGKTSEGKEFEKLKNQDSFGASKGEQEKLTQEAQKMQDEAKALQDQKQMERYAKEKASKLANDDLAKFAPQIQQAQQDFTKYKKKVEWVKEGTGPNANSLKDEPFKKRLTYGGNFQVPSLDPFSFVAAPFVGYRINKKFTSGVSLTYKATFGNKQLKTFSTGSEYGYRVFTDYKLIKSWFGHGEFEQIHQLVASSTKDEFKREWKSNAYIGVGRQIDAIKGMKINVMFLCNLLHKDLQYFNVNAFQFRFGVSK